MTANAGYHLFNTGDVLTAAQVQYNLQNQTIMYFASSAARTSALSGVLVEGMFSYLADTDSTEYYSGSAWTSISNPGDITAVSAGNGLSGGGTSGAVSLAIDTAITVDKTTAQTLTNKTLTSPALTTPTISTLTTNGDLLYGTGSGALSRLGIGSSAQVLTVTGGVPVWATPASGSTFSGCSVYNSAAQTIANVTTTTFTWNSEYFDTDSYHSTSSNTSRITIPSGKTGKFLLFFNLFYDSGSGLTNINIAKNGSNIGRYDQNMGLTKTQSVTEVLNLTAGDYLELTIYQTTGGNLTTIGTFCSYGVVYLGA